MMSEQNLYVCCMFSVSCPHKPVRALEDKMDGTWEESVTDDLNRLECLLSSTASVDDPNSTDGDFSVSSTSRVAVQTVNSFSNSLQQPTSFQLDDSSSSLGLDDTLLRDSFDLASTVSMANVATALLQEAIEDEHPNLLNGHQYNRINSIQSSTSENFEPVEELTAELCEILDPDKTLSETPQLSVIEDDMESGGQSSSSATAEESVENRRPPRKRGRPKKIKDPDEKAPQFEPKPMPKAAAKPEEAVVQPRGRGRPRKQRKSTEGSTERPPSSIASAPTPTAGTESASPAPQPKKRGRPKKVAQQTTSTDSPSTAETAQILISSSLSVASPSASSSHVTNMKSATVVETNPSTEWPSAAPITADADGTVPCEVRLSRLTEDELLQWTGSKTPVVWRPNTDDLKIKISLSSSGDGHANVSSSSSAAVIANSSSSGAVIENVDEAPVKRKRSRHKKESDATPQTAVPMESSSPPPPPARPPRPTVSLKETKTKTGGDTRCFSCNTPLLDKADEWLNELGAKSVYCSVACIDTQVSRAKEVFDDTEEYVVVMDQGCGKVVGAPVAPRLHALGQFLRQNANFCPVLPAIVRERPGVQSALYCSSAATQLLHTLASLEIEADSSTDRRKMDNKLLSPQVDTIRMNVRRAVKDCLTARIKDAEDVLLNSNEVREVAIRVEEALFRQCRQSTGGRYKSWCKCFLTHLKDPNNQGLFRRVLSGELSPAKLASLEPADLGAKALSKPPPTSLVPIDAGAIFSPPKTDNGPKVAEVIVPSKSAPIKTDAGRPSRDALEDIMGFTRDTTSEHKSHLFDLNCCICSGKSETDSEKSKRKQKKKSGNATPTKDPPSRVKLPSTVDTRQPKQKEMEIAARAQMIEDDDNMDTAMDDYDGVGSSPRTEVDARSPKSDGDPWKSDLTIWSGEMVMAGYFRFQSTLTAVSGACAFALRDELPEEIEIVGRIPPIVVWEYIKTVKRTVGKDLIVLKANEPDDAENRAQYEGLFNNMRAKGRYVVVGRLNHRVIKDFYLLPLSSNDSPPEELLPLDGVGLPPPGARRNLILCVVVRNREDAPIPQPVPPPDVVHTPPEQSCEVGEEQEETPKRPSPSISPTMVLVGGSKTAKDAEHERVNNVIYGMVESQQTPPQPEYTVVRTWKMPGNNKGPSDGLDEAYDPADDDYLISPQTFESEKRPPATPVVPSTGALAQSVGDLLIAIHTGDDPAQIADMVQTFLAERDLANFEQQIVYDALENKVSQEKARRGAPPLTSLKKRASPILEPVAAHEPDFQLDQPAMSFLSQGGPPSFLSGEWRVPPRAQQRAARLPVNENSSKPPTNEDDMDIEEGEIYSSQSTPNEQRSSAPSSTAVFGQLLLPPPPPPPDLDEQLPPPPPRATMPLVAAEANDYFNVGHTGRQPKRPSQPWDNYNTASHPPFVDNSGMMDEDGQRDDESDAFEHAGRPPVNYGPAASSHHFEPTEHFDEMHDGDSRDQSQWNGNHQGPPPPWSRGRGGPPPPGRFPRMPQFRGRGAPVFGMQPPRFRPPPPMPMRGAPFGRAPFPFGPRGPPRFARPPFRGGPQRFRPPPPDFYENY